MSMQRNGTLADAAPAAESGAHESQDLLATDQQTPSESSPASDGTPEERTGNDWFRQAFNAQRYGGRVTRQPEAPARSAYDLESESSSGAPGTEPASAAGQNGQSNAPAPAAPSSQQEQQRASLQISQAEFDRRVQAETDRRLDKFQREQAERRKLDERRRLRDTDPYGYAALEKEEEAKREALQRELAGAHQMTLSTVQTYDKSVLDPIMKAIPEADRRAILASIEPGLPGRGQAANQALKVLENHWKAVGVAEARKTLMKDQSFIKEILAKFGGVRQEVDHIPARSAAAGRGANVNDSLRMAAKRVIR